MWNSLGASPCPKESFLSVLDAQRSVYAAEDQLVQSDRNTAVTLIAIYKALGGEWGS